MDRLLGLPAHPASAASRVAQPAEYGQEDEHNHEDDDHNADDAERSDGVPELVPARITPAATSVCEYVELG